MDENLIAIILTALLAVLSAFGVVRVYFGKFFKAVKESADVGLAISNAAVLIESILQDNVVTADEIKEAKKKFKNVESEIKQAKKAWEDLFKKVNKKS